MQKKSTNRDLPEGQADRLDALQHREGGVGCNHHADTEPQAVAEGPPGESELLILMHHKLPKQNYFYPKRPKMKLWHNLPWGNFPSAYIDCFWSLLLDSLQNAGLAKEVAPINHY
jgi:hypothetical protein